MKVLILIVVPFCYFPQFRVHTAHVPWHLAVMARHHSRARPTFYTPIVALPPLYNIQRNFKKKYFPAMPMS